MKLSILPFYLSEKYDQVDHGDVFASRVRAIGQMGFNAIEINLKNPDLVDVDAFRRLMEESGVELAAVGTGRAYMLDGLCFSSPDAANRKAAVARVKRHVDFSCKTGKPPVIIGLVRGKVAPNASEAERAQVERWFLEGFKECAQYAGSHDVPFVLEPLNRYETNIVNSVAQGLEVLDRTGCSHAGLLLDTFHMNIEEVSIEESIKRAGKRIGHFHVADSNRWPPGCGHLDFASILKTLGGTGYQRYVSGEIFHFDDPLRCAKETLEFLRKTLAVTSR